MKKYIISLLLCMLVTSLIGCEKEEPIIYEDEYFQYVIVNPDLIMGHKYSYIVGLTELGKQQKVLTIPHSLGGRELRRIGYETKAKGGVGDISSDNLEKLYVDIYAEDITNSVFSKTVYVVTSYDNGTTFLKYESFVFCLGNLDILNDKNLPENILSRYKLGNVLFKRKNSNNEWKVVGYDNFDNKLISLEYSYLTNWYKDEELTILWDFENKIITEPVILYCK